jgi:GT2 family glycosyltransferase
LPELSIVIVSFNARGDLERCLASLHDAEIQTPHEIVVVDNASSDGSADAARRWPNVRVIEAGANVGFARGCNIGIRNSTGTNILLLNSDTLVYKHGLDWMVQELGRRPDIAVVGPRLMDGEHRVELSFGPMMSPLNELWQKTLVRGHARRDPLLSLLVERKTRRERTPDWVSGACLLVRRHDAEAVGLLDERYFMYAEDVDFCAAIRARGRKILFTPAVEIVHLRGKSAKSAPSATLEAYRRSHIAFYEKHHPFWAPLLKLYLGRPKTDV